MGLCIDETSRKKKAHKTIVIPKGTIDPNTSNVIEIPLNLDTNSSLVVKAPTDSNPSFTVEPFREGHVYISTTPPPRSPPPRILRKSEDEVPSVSAEPSTAYSQTPRVQYTQTPPVQYYQTTPLQMRTSNSFPRHVDFSTQTYNEGNRPVSRPIEESHSPHSPLCPICAKASCKYLLRPYNQYVPVNPYATSECFRCPAAKSHTTSDSSSLFSRPLTFPSYVSNARSEATCERDLVNNLLDEKLNKLIKPLLLQIAKYIPDDCARNTDSSLFKTRSNPTPIQDYSRCNIPYLNYDDGRNWGESFYQRGPPLQQFQYEDYRRRPLYVDDVFDSLDRRPRNNFTRGNMISPTIDYQDDYRRRKKAHDVDRDRNDDGVSTSSLYQCQPEASCQKKKKTARKSNELSRVSSRISIEDTLNSAFVASNQSLNLND